MDSAWLEDFLALVDGGHFSRAAEQRGITQPAFSRRVRALEDWVGGPLFDRDSQPVTLTPAGLRFRPVAEETLRRLYQGREAARAAGRAAAETLRFAATQALSLTFFPPWLRALEARESFSATVHLTAAHMAACEQVMLRGEAQFLLCHHHPAAASFLMSEPFRSLPVGTDHLLPVSAPVPGAATPLFSPSETSGTPVPLLGFSGESGIGRILAATRAVEESGARLGPSFTSHLASVLVAMARDGRGLAWAPMSLVADDLARGTLVRAAGPERDIAIEIRLYRARARQSPPAERLWAAVAGGSGTAGG
ncbi:LysR family transcriptional regulator [Methylobacterium sp. Leaf104]|uniref:LysR family transcriptional regulator n=1 Tax=Methylobacterium TaxID=407 RepID=UPI0006F39B89|nr:MULTISPECIES: LysR family transcriptional regulator [Methylobacterium]KQP29716.1 LysR family transcriptional regulator [Methylobacterium sp. Leaf104]MCI9881726.1 LysR family transcriptional regulator [Methylobacterium goesingense]